MRCARLISFYPHPSAPCTLGNSLQPEIHTTPALSSGPLLGLIIGKQARLSFPHPPHGTFLVPARAMTHINDLRTRHVCRGAL